MKNSPFHSSNFPFDSYSRAFHKKQKAPQRVHKIIIYQKMFGKQKAHPKSDVHEKRYKPDIQHTAGDTKTIR